MNKTFKYLLVSYAVLGMVDLIQTVYGLSVGFGEANIFVHGFMDNVFLLSCYKIVGTGVIIGIAMWLHYRLKEYNATEIALVVVGFGIFIQGLTVINNFLVLLGVY